MSTDAKLTCKGCGLIVGYASMTVNLAAALPLQYRGLAAMIPRDTNIGRAVVDVLEIKCVGCHQLSENANGGKESDEKADGEKVVTQARHAQSVRDGQQLAPIGG